MTKCTDSEFRDLLEVLWRTGARPFELYQCDARHYDRANGRLVLSRKAGDTVKAKPNDKNAVRYIYLDDEANAIVARLAEQAEKRLEATRKAGIQPKENDATGAPFTNRTGERRRCRVHAGLAETGRLGG